jgi:hypothetical protein
MKCVEDALQMSALTEEEQMRRRICCANVEYFLRVNQMYDMSGERSEIWASAHSKRVYARKLKETKGEIK